MEKSKSRPHINIGTIVPKQPTKITRFEFITKENGREIVRYGEFTFQLQDDGRTLKVFQENFNINT